ncbi:hypothetical protein [Alphaproteobacteria bacterium endosymbiont of Tiliacea citrago]|uniref:hypothetical protein n=1 Tax=Alphaproteobacteria bacterium endosymbiont of Tiliacea citrago TaxID=3077944 RepID=UPI00313C30A8
MLGCLTNLVHFSIILNYLTLSKFYRICRKISCFLNIKFNPCVHYYQMDSFFNFACFVAFFIVFILNYLEQKEALKMLKKR